MSARGRAGNHPTLGGYRDHGLQSHTQYTTGRKQPILSSGPRIRRRAQVPPRPEPWAPRLVSGTSGWRGTPDRFATQRGRRRSRTDNGPATDHVARTRRRYRPWRHPLRPLHGRRFRPRRRDGRDLIGARINKPWKIRTWLPVFATMPKMPTYLVAQSEKGLLGYEQALLPSPIIVQYWRSFEDLTRFARDHDPPSRVLASIQQTHR
ncbi:monooxygenase family protein [Rhodococcus koreensis]